MKTRLQDRRFEIGESINANSNEFWRRVQKDSKSFHFALVFFLMCTAHKRAGFWSLDFLVLLRLFLIFYLFLNLSGVIIYIWIYIYIPSWGKIYAYQVEKSLEIIVYEIFLIIYHIIKIYTKPYVSYKELSHPYYIYIYLNPKFYVEKNWILFLFGPVFVGKI